MLKTHYMFDTWVTLEMEEAIQLPRTQHYIHHNFRIQLNDVILSWDSGSRITAIEFIPLGENLTLSNYCLHDHYYDDINGVLKQHIWLETRTSTGIGVGGGAPPLFGGISLSVETAKHKFHLETGWLLLSRQPLLFVHNGGVAAFRCRPEMPSAFFATRSAWEDNGS